MSDVWIQDSPAQRLPGLLVQTEMRRLWGPLHAGSSPHRRVPARSALTALPKHPRPPAQLPFLWEEAPPVSVGRGVTPCVLLDSGPCTPFLLSLPLEEHQHPPVVSAPDQCQALSTDDCVWVEQLHGSLVWGASEHMAG